MLLSLISSVCEEEKGGRHSRRLLGMRDRGFTEHTAAGACGFSIPSLTRYP